MAHTGVYVFLWVGIWVSWANTGGVLTLGAKQLCFEFYGSLMVST